MLEAVIQTQEIVVTAARTPQDSEEVAASATIIDRDRIDRLGEPLVLSFLRLAPSASVASSGPAGSQAQLRIRGAEANHTLLFVDGIRANDPAAGNEPRLELLNADIASRIEVVRGPQSALWGSEAIGGVVAINGLSPATPGFSVLGETGSFGFARTAASGAVASERGSLAASAGWQRADGIDSFDGTGDRDGHRNLAGRMRATWDVAQNVELGVAGFAIAGESQYDGLSPLTFLRADTLDSTRNRLWAGRVWSRFGESGARWSGELAASLLGSGNRNLLAEEEINRTRGRRATISAQGEHRFEAGGASHLIVAAAEHAKEEFRARDVIYGGFSNQDRSRTHDALTLQWRGATGPLVADAAIRHDKFNRFKDATSLRGSLLARLGAGFSAALSYGEGIAQPTFFDLYGLFPGSFIGNPSLKPENSQSVEASLRYDGPRFEVSLTGYRQRLADEIVDIFDASTFTSTTANRREQSRRDGLEAEIGWFPSDALRVTANYAFLDASEPGTVEGNQVREVRRPRHSGAIAVDGVRARLRYGGSLTFTGARRDMDFDLFPAQPVRLGSYWLAGARLGYRVTDSAEIFLRASNAFDQGYQDVFGYRTEGRSLHAGIRLADWR